MIKLFYLISILLLVMIASVGAHYTLSDRKVATESINTVTALTKISSPSLSVAFWEPRIMGSQKAGNIAYPEMMPMNRMDFVYAR